MNKTRTQKKPFFYGGVKTRSQSMGNPSGSIINKKTSSLPDNRRQQIRNAVSKNISKKLKKKKPPSRTSRFYTLVQNQIIPDIKRRNTQKLATIIKTNLRKILNLADLKRMAEENVKLIEKLFRRNKIGVEYYTSNAAQDVISVYLYLGSNYDKRYFYKTTFGFHNGFDDGTNHEDFMEFIDSIRGFLPKYKVDEFLKSRRENHLYFYTTLCLLNGFYFAYLVQGYIMSKAYLAGAIYAEKEDMTDISDKIKNFNIMLCFYPKDFTSLRFRGKYIESNPYIETPDIGIIRAFDNDAINKNDMDELEKSYRDQDEVSSIGYSLNSPASESASYSDDSSFHTVPDSESESYSDVSSLQSVSGSSVATAISMHDPGKLAVLSDTVRLMYINLLRVTKKVNDKFGIDDIDSKKEKIDIQEASLNEGGWSFDIPDLAFHKPLEDNKLKLVSIPIEDSPRQ